MCHFLQIHSKTSHNSHFVSKKWILSQLSPNDKIGYKIKKKTGSSRPEKGKNNSKIQKIVIV